MIEQNKKMFEYINLNSYHDSGFTGKGIRVCILENDSDHRDKVTACLREASPDCEIVHVPSRYANEEQRSMIAKSILASEAMLVNMSRIDCGMTKEEVQGLLNSGMTLFMAAGNRDSKGVSPGARDPNWLSVGAAKMPVDTPIREKYSSIGEELDTIAFIPYIDVGYIHQENGTSFASPFLAGTMACYYQHYMEQNGQYPSPSEIAQLLISSSIDLGDPGFDVKYGNGMFVLPELVTGIGGEEVLKEYIILHHSATKDGLLKDFDAIKKYHMEVNGWRDIGYHWVVERIDGVLTAIPGRAESEAGAHCLGHNSDAIGICIVGDYTKAPPDDETYRFVAAQCKQIKARHPIKEIAGHRNYYATACPGDKFDVEKVRQYVKGGHAVEDIKGRWSEENINLVVQAGLMKGYPDGTFKPEQAVTREELATVLARLIKEGVPTV